MRKLILPLILLASFFANAETTTAGKLSVVINSAENNKGVVELHLINSNAQFEGQTDAFRVCIEQVFKQTANCEFEKLPYGEYAIYAFHDQNEDGKLNTSVFGAPTEKVVVSAVDLAVNESPTFSQSKFLFNSVHGQVFLNLQ